MQLIVSPAAAKEILTLPSRDRDALLAKAGIFAAEPFASHPWAMPLRGATNRFRIRQRDWRGIMLVLRERNTIILEQVAHRREVYR